VLQPAVGKDVTDHVKAGLPLSKLAEPGEIRPPSARMEVLSAREVMQLPDPDEEGYLLGPLIYRGHRIVVGGWTGHGKTTFTLHMTAAATYGREFLGWEGKGNLRALVVDVEQGTRTIKRRIRETGLEDSDRVKYLRVPDGLALNSDEDAIAMMEKIFVDGRYDIVLADPLYKLTTGDLNDTRAATELMRRFDDWRDRYQFALILPMHCRKPKPDSQLSPHDLFGSSAWQWGAEMLLGLERKSRSHSWLHWWKDREGECTDVRATVGQHWSLDFRRETGFRLYDTGVQEQMFETAPTRRFDLARFIYEEIRERGPVTRENIKDRAWLKHQLHYDDKTLDRALKNVGQYGVQHNGAPRNKDRVYFLQPDLLTQAESPGGEPGLASSIPTTEQGPSPNEEGGL
jgi:hypothetical protein